jgi:quercetin dioxygenase-like cupin family protein
VLEGCGSLTTGGTLANPKEFAKDDPEVLAVIGPTAQGTAIEGGSTRKIGAGDMVVIPVDTPHGFADICREGISYVLVRVDKGRVLKVK